MTSAKQLVPAFLHPAWTLSLPLLTLTAVLASPAQNRLFTALLAAAVIVLMQWLIPKCRFRTDHYFSPLNLALGLLLVKLIIAPVMVMIVGAGNDLFVAVPSRESMEGAVIIDLFAYVAFCLGLFFASDRLTDQRPPSMIAALFETPGPVTAIVFAAAGLLGFILVFGSPGRIVAYFLDPATSADMKDELEGSWSGFLGTILRPFLAFALVAWWARCVDRTAPSKGIRGQLLAGVVAAIGITLANLTFSFNRAAFVFPVLSLVAVYSARVRRIPPLVTAIALGLLLPVLFLLAHFRASRLPGAVADDSKTTQASMGEANDTVQGYAGGPPLAGLFLQELKWGEHLFGGSTLVASAFSPVPILGKSFRDSSGSALYNNTLYGMPGWEDQIIPFSSELFVNLHVFGVVSGFFMLGLALSKAQLFFAAAQSAFGAFAMQYIATWGATLSVWSLSVFCQIAIYFLWPIYLYWAAVQSRNWLRGMRVQRAGVSHF